MKNKNIGIYMILNTINMKAYIGSSVEMSTRKTHHFCDLKGNRHHSSHLQKAYNKYGENKFIFLVLECGLERKELHERESFYIGQEETLDRNKGYNMGIPHRNDNLKLRPETIELKRRIAYKQYFGVTTEEEYQKWYEAKYNPQQTPKKIHTNAKALKSISKAGVETIYPSLAHAAKALGSNEEHIRRVFRRQNKTHKGMRWERI